ncbi:MAG: VWA domain-containing protein [Candidatus Neomarinimicrobiota bacterium]
MISFEYPYAFIFYAFLLLLTIHGWFARKREDKEAGMWGDEMVRRRLFARMNSGRSQLKRHIRWWGLALLIFAAAGPQMGTKLTEIERRGVDILIAVDISSSMKAEDVKPNRLEKAKFEISRLISGLKGDRIGLIVFAGTSHLYLPLTGDYEAARVFVDAVDTGMIQTQGTALAEAVNRAIQAFPEGDSKYSVLIVVTDGEDHEGGAVEMARKASESGIVVHAVGVGTSRGSLIPVSGEEGNRVDFKKDRKGKLITSTLNVSVLREFAAAGGGEFVRFDNRSSGTGELLNLIKGMEKRTLRTHEYTEFEDRYQLFAALALIMFAGDALISNRRKDRREWRGRFV